MAYLGVYKKFYSNKLFMFNQSGIKLGYSSSETDPKST